MKRRQLKERCLSLFLALILMFALAPAASAADAPWATDAVTALNAVYGAGTFSADMDINITVADVKNLLTITFGYSVDDASALVTGADTDNATRLQLSQVVCRVYGLAENLSAGEFPDCNDPAVITLRGLGIVVGFGDGYFHPEGTATHADLAVIFYRALGKAGAGGGMALDGIKPGAYGYDEIMYLAARGCVPFSVDPAAQLSSATIPVSDGTTLVDYVGKQAIWEAWCARLESLPPASSRTVAWTAFGAAPDTVLDAAVQIVAEDRASLNDDNIEGIFSDVRPASWFYDGVMYLFNNGIVKGYGDGTFGPSNLLPRDQMAALVCKVNNIDTYSPAVGVTVTDVAADNWAYNAVTHALAEGYMTYTDGTNFSPQTTVNRQEAALAVFRCYSYDAADVNLSVLNRFSDGAQVDADYQAAMAYLVSAGIINGNAQGQISPASPVDRATFGVLLARVMMGLDTSKMHDYETAVTEVLP